MHTENWFSILINLLMKRRFWGDFMRKKIHRILYIKYFKRGPKRPTRFSTEHKKCNQEAFEQKVNRKTIKLFKL